MNETNLYHLNIDKNFRAGYAIVPGDPGRVDKIAAFLDEAVFLANNREFRSFAGKLCGETVIVCSTGIGGPSAAIALEELSMLGVHTAVRIGTCGGISQKVQRGDLIAATAAVRMDGCSKEYAPIEYPAVSDFGVCSAIVRSADALGYRIHTGVIQSKDSFYGQHSPESMPTSAELLNKWEAWKRLGVLASEMEASTLFTVGAVRGIRTGCVLHAVWNQELPGGGTSAADLDMDATVKTAVAAIKLLISEDKNG